MLTTDGRTLSASDIGDQPFFGTAPKALLEGMADHPDLEVHVISSLRAVVPSPEKLAANIWYHPVVTPKIGWMTTAYQGCIRAVRRKLREIEPDIVHGQGTERNCAMEAVFSGYPNVLTLHGNMRAIAKVNHARPFSYMWLNAHLERFVLGRTWGVFCNSAYTQEQVAPLAKKVWRVPNALQSAFFVPPHTPRDQPARARIINIGLITPRKRQVEILEMVEALHQQGCELEILFIGAGSSSAYRSRFDELVRKGEAAGYARYLGPLPAQEVIEWMDRSEAILHFPIEEAFGLVAAEGLSRNLKFFGADIGGIPEIVSGVELAECYRSDDWEGLKRGIVRWLQNGRPTPQTAAAAMTDRYHPRQLGNQHLQIYREVLSTE